MNYVECRICGCPAGVKGLPAITNQGIGRESIYVHVYGQCPPDNLVKVVRKQYGLDGEVAEEKKTCGNWVIDGSQHWLVLECGMKPGHRVKEHHSGATAWKDGSLYPYVPPKKKVKV